MYRRSISIPCVLFTFVAAAGVAIAAASSWQKEAPTEWSSEDVYQILHNSPWAKTVSVTEARGSANGAQGGGGNGGVWGEGMPGGGMGRGGGGWGGGGMGRRRSGYPSNGPESNVTVEWSSALPVRLAEMKLAGDSPDAAALKPMNEYVISVSGLPKSHFESQSGSNSDEDDSAFADHLKVITVLTIGHERLNPSKVELNQGRDARTVFHFDKSEPVTTEEKTAEFRITADRAEIKKKFVLKEMEYQGKLEL